MWIVSLCSVLPWQLEAMQAHVSRYLKQIPSVDVRCSLQNGLKYREQCEDRTRAD